MNGFIKFTLRSREGLPSYLTGMGAVMGGLFFAHLIMLIIMVEDGFVDKVTSPMYELAGVCFAGVFFAITADRMVRFGVNCGTSRHTIMLGLAAVSPLFALATTAVIQLSRVLTNLFFGLFGKQLGNLAEYFVEYYSDRYLYAVNYKFDILNVGLVFILTMFAYTFALMFLGVRGRKGSKAGIAAALALAFAYWLYMANEYGIFNEREPVYELLEYTANSTQIGHVMINGEYPSLIGGLMVMTALTFVVFALVFIIYARISRHAPVCGKEESF